MFSSTVHSRDYHVSWLCSALDRATSLQYLQEFISLSEQIQLVAVLCVT